MAGRVSDPLPEGIAVRRVWFGIAPDGSEHEIELRVSTPQPRNDDWCAIVSLGTLDPECIRPIYGVDSWQAMNLAQRFVQTMVSSYEKGGWHFFWSRGGDPATAQQLGIHDVWPRADQRANPDESK